MRGLVWGGVGPKLRVSTISEEEKIYPPLFLKIVSSQTNIRNAIFDQRSTRPPEVGVGTDRQTHGHGDSMTNSAQWGRVGENYATSLDKKNHATSWEKINHATSRDKKSRHLSGPKKVTEPLGTKNHATSRDKKIT